MTLKRLDVRGTIEYDADSMHMDNPEEIQWFYYDILMDDLIVHSNEIGDEIGILRITSIQEEA